MWDFELNQTSYKLYAISNYCNGKSTWNEFFNDMKLFNTVYRLMSIKESKNSSINPILNNIIKLSNVFKKESFGRLLLILSPIELRSNIKTILIYLHRLPKSIPEFNIDEIPINKELEKELSNL